MLNIELPVSVRGRIPYFVRPPESTRSSDVAAVGEAGADAEEAQEATWNKADEKAFGTGRVPGVVQPLHQIVNRQRFIEDDSDKVNAQPGDFNNEEEEWTGIAVAEGDEAPEVIENDLDASDDAEVSGEAADDNEDDDNESVAWEDLVGGQSAAASSSPAKKRQLDTEDFASDEDEGKKIKKQAKEPRMKTNKKKAENFFTHANVKNKNRERKIPRVEGRKKR